jgi:mRNA interferase MazF
MDDEKWLSGEELNKALDLAFDKLRTNVETLDAKNRNLMARWLGTYSDYIVKEKTFKPLEKTLKYEPGTILTANLGYNPGSEHGGNHFCVVVEDNAKSSPVVMVVPLGSSKPEKPVHFNDVDLGVIPEINALSHYPEDTKSIATVSQMRAISKLRIIAPVTRGDQIIDIDPSALQSLYAKIRERFTTKGLNRKPKKQTTATSQTSKVR